MVFSSPIFIFAFLPAFFAAYYLLPRRFRSLLILIGSYVFYGWWRLDFLALLIGVTAYTYGASLVIVRARTERVAKRAMIAGVAGDLLSLAYFKYFNFGIESFNALVGNLGLGGGVSVWSVVLPIGISFYVFQAVSYLVDVWRGDAKPARSIWDFAAFIALFPQLIAGPVLRYRDMAEQFRSREHSFDRFSEGAGRFMLGFCKKVLIADTIAPIVDVTFAQAHPTFSEAWLGAIAYTAQLYFDFSGYSDMAIGLGLMMGFRIIENFNRPYLSRSITEFWRRWHISLSTWLRHYLYIPLGGNRLGRQRTYVNLLITMVLGGLWHGAAWTFVLWGAWHGLALAAERFALERRGVKPGEATGPYPAALGLPATFLIVVLGWVLFRAPDVATAGGFYAGMMGVNGFALGPSVALQVTELQMTTLAVAFLLIFAPALEGIRLPGWGSARLAVAGGPSVEVAALAQPVRWLLAGLFVLAVLKLMAAAYSPFLYFQF